MADTLKFGPQWLRALSDGNAVTSPPPSPGFVAKYKLAEHRYGREEMLALYLPNTKMPDIMKEFPSIASEKCLQPMAFITPTDDEQRLMAQGVNSTAVLRLFGRGGGPSVRGMGRGGIERGRGRGRGRGEAGFYARGSSFDEEGFGRGRPGRGAEWDEAEGRRLERSFSGRPSFEETATSPRREFSRSMSSDNWREAKKGGGGSGGGSSGGGGPEEEDGDGDWRRAGPRDKLPTTGSRASWREARERDHDHYERGGHHRGERIYQRSRSTGSHDDDPELPEWSMADLDDIEDNFIGTFDASGAFVTLKDAKDDPRYRDGARQRGEMGQGDSDESGHDEIKPKQNVRQNNNESENWDEEVEPPEMKPKILPGQKINAEKVVNQDGQRHTGKSRSLEKPPNMHIDRHPQSQNQDRFSGPSRSAEGVRHESGVQHIVNEKMPNKESSPGPNALSTSDINMNKKNMRREDEHPHITSKSPEVVDDRTRVTPSPHARVVDHQQQQPVPQQHSHRRVAPQEADFGHLEKAAEDLVDQWEAEEDSRLHHKFKVEHADKWFYRDPQGDLQGPFSSQDMTEWFTAGYFTMNLLVKRGCDEIFHPLGELIKRWGRVPFIPGPQPPPLTASQVENPVAPPAMSSAPNIPVQTPMTSGTVPASVPNMPNIAASDQLKQQLLLQQHLFLRQMQMQQAAMNPQQQQNMLLGLLMQQQQVASMMKVNQAPSPPPQQMPRPASGEGVATSQAAFQNPLNDPAIQSYQRSLSQPATMEQAWPPNNPPMTAAAGWHGGANAGPSVWDMEPTKNTPSPNMEEIQRAEAEKQARDAAAVSAAREAAARDAAARDAAAREAAAREAVAAREAAARDAERERKEAEERSRREEEHRRRLEEEEEKRRKASEEEERRRQADMERQRLEQLRREQEDMRRRQVEEEKRQREEEERKRREEEERKRREEEERRRREEEERLRRDQEEIEKKRLEEISRRQKAEEIRRQQEAVRRIQQQEQLQNIQLPSTAQWGSGATGSATTNAPSLEEIQRMEAEKLKEQQEEQHRLELQRQQMAALHRQQQQSTTWAAQARAAAQPSPMSLRKIQQEQALQLESNRQKAPTPKPNNVPLATAAAWGSGGAPSGGNWAADSAWGRPAPSAAGFWDEPAPSPKPTKKQSAPAPNPSFPPLNTAKKNKPESNINKIKAAKSKKEEETIQRLFQAHKPKDDFTQWCETALVDIESSVDVPTFIAFLQDVDSPYEVHDYARNYLGDTRESEEFATQFLEKRSKFKNKIKQQQKPEEPIWGPAPAVNPNLKHQQHQQHQQNQQQQQLQQQQQQLLLQQQRDDDDASHKKKSKKKMQKVDNSFLGFTVLAAPDRINIGEIDSIDTI